MERWDVVLQSGCSVPVWPMQPFLKYGPCWWWHTPVSCQSRQRDELQVKKAVMSCTKNVQNPLLASPCFMEHQEIFHCSCGVEDGTEVSVLLPSAAGSNTVHMNLCNSISHHLIESVDEMWYTFMVFIVLSSPSLSCLAGVSSRPL